MPAATPDGTGDGRIRTAGLPTALGLGVAAGCILLGPYLVGVVPNRVDFLFLIGVLAVVAFLARGRYSRLALKWILLTVAGSLALTSVDLILRPLLRQRIHFRPSMAFIGRWPPMPELERFHPNIRYQGTTYGDLAAMSGISAHREPRSIAFSSDRFGFRNAGPPRESGLDIILLGDSFGMGAGTSQESTVASLLEEGHGLATYNLAIPGTGLWDGLLNLKVELPRLPIRDGTTLVWLVFTGNDLVDVIHPDLEPRLVPGGWRRLRTVVDDFRLRSPLRMLLARVPFPRVYGNRERVIEGQFPGPRTMLFYRPYLEASRWTLAQVRAHPNFPGVQAVLTDLRDLASRHSLEVLVVSVPTKGQIYPWVLKGSSPWSGPREASGFALALGELSGALGFGFLDLQPFLLEEAPELFAGSGEIHWWYDDTHWNPRGHELAARRIRAHLAR